MMADTRDEVRSVDQVMLEMMQRYNTIIQLGGELKPEYFLEMVRILTHHYADEPTKARVFGIARSVTRTHDRRSAELDRVGSTSLDITTSGSSTTRDCIGDEVVGTEWHSCPESDSTYSDEFELLSPSSLTRSMP